MYATLNATLTAAEFNRLRSKILKLTVSQRRVLRSELRREQRLRVRDVPELSAQRRGLKRILGSF